MITMLLLSAFLVMAQDEPRVLTWDDLIPEGETAAVPPEDFDINSPAHAGGVGVQTGSSKTIPELDGELIKLPGFMLPLDYTKKGEVKSFLLVPYYGACIHVPPPPPNQIVFVETGKKPLRAKGLWDPIWATGKMEIKTNVNGLGNAAYTLHLTAVEPYKE